MQRLKNLRAKIEDEKLDGLLITSSSNLRYMTNFTGTAGVAIVTLTEAKFITDFRYTEQAEEQAQAYEVIEHHGNILDEIASQVQEMKVKRLGFEQEHVTYHTYRLYEQKFSAELVPISNLIEQLRLIKDEEEIQILQQAAKIADDAFEHIITYIKPGISERSVANELEFFMRKQGATSSSFDIIVASGTRSALPHGVATEKKIEQGDLITLDYGAYFQGYCSDITRTIAVGEPTERMKDIYSVVYNAQQLGVQQIKSGMSGKEADAITRDYISEKGFGDYFGHSTGHGIGLDVHEGPTLSMRSEQVLKPGMVVTVEPGIYLAGVGGVRIEDDIVITDEGNERLTHATKELIIL